MDLEEQLNQPSRKLILQKSFSKIAKCFYISACIDIIVLIIFVSSLHFLSKCKDGVVEILIPIIICGLGPSIRIQSAAFFLMVLNLTLRDYRLVRSYVQISHFINILLVLSSVCYAIFVLSAPYFGKEIGNRFVLGFGFLGYVPVAFYLLSLSLKARKELKTIYDLKVEEETEAQTVGVGDGDSAPEEPLNVDSDQPRVSELKTEDEEIRSVGKEKSGNRVAPQPEEFKNPSVKHDAREDSPF